MRVITVLIVLLPALLPLLGCRAAVVSPGDVDDEGSAARHAAGGPAWHRSLLQSSQSPQLEPNEDSVLSVCTAEYNPLVRLKDRANGTAVTYGSPISTAEFLQLFEGHDVELLAALVELRTRMAFPLDRNNSVTVTVHRTFPSALYATRSGACDMAIGGFVRSTRRDKCECPALPAGASAAEATENEICCLDFSTHYLRAGYSILSFKRFHNKVFVDHLKSYKDLITILCILVLLLLVSGHLIWFIERNANSEQFPKSYVDGVDDGLWWSVVTMTTVGYGDKAPMTMWGRFIGVVWMFVGLFIFSTFSGIVASTTMSDTDLITFKGLDALVRRDLDVCTVGGDYQRFILSSDIKMAENGLRGPDASMITRQNLTDCYAYMAKQSNATILFDRFAFMAEAAADSSEWTPSWGELLEASENGLVVSPVMETTHYALAFSEGSSVLPSVLPHLSAILSGALIFSELSEQMKMGWSMNIAYRRWISDDDSPDTYFLIDHSTDSDFDDFRTMAALLIFTAVVYSVYLCVQLGIPAIQKRRRRTKVGGDEEGDSSLLDDSGQQESAGARGASGKSRFEVSDPTQETSMRRAGALPPINKKTGGGELGELRAEIMELKALVMATMKRVSHA